MVGFSLSCRRLSTTALARDSNQAIGLAKYALEFMRSGTPSKDVYHRVQQFHTDSVMCGISALAMKTNAPNVLRDEALTYPSAKGATVFGSNVPVAPEKAICANASAVREWDSNGTVFGFNDKLGKAHQAGEFGHNDFYPVIIAAAQQRGDIDGRKALQAMILSDEIRGRLAEVFSLKTFKIDHVVHGAIASAVTYGALMGATPEQIEAAVGMVVAHYIPYRAIRAGHQLSDSKGASAAISTEAAIVSMKRAMAGFVGPKDIFRNPEAIFRLNVPQQDKQCPFNIVLSNEGRVSVGSDFSVMGMHFKLGLYEHQSAGALQGVIDLIRNNKEAFAGKGASDISKIVIKAYEPAFGIIGDPAKRDPTTRQSADHSMVFIVSRLLKKALSSGSWPSSNDAAWCDWMLTPYDYGAEALFDKETRTLMEKVEFVHGGPEFDKNYPDGIPTSVDIHLSSGGTLSSGFVMYPSGHARNTSADLEGILAHKHEMLGEIAMADSGERKAFLQRLQNIESLSPQELASVYSFDWAKLRSHAPIDG